MARRQFISSNKALPIVLVLTLIAGLMPHNWLGWANDLHQVISFPLTPFGNAMSWVGAQLRSPKPITEDVPEEARQYVEHLKQERELFKRLYYAEQARAERLREQLEQLQALPPAYTNSQNIQTIGATITQSNPSDPLGAVELNRGRRSGVLPGTIGVYDGVHLVGRVVSVSRLHSQLLPLTNPATGLINGAIVPPGNQSIRLEARPRVQLEPLGNGTFVGHVDKQEDVTKGDHVRLIDRTWPDTAQGMLIGVIRSMKVRDEQPLQHRIVVTPTYRVYQLSFITLIVEAAGNADRTETNNSEDAGGGDD